jgi:hypothetical protein
MIHASYKFHVSYDANNPQAPRPTPPYSQRQSIVVEVLDVHPPHDPWNTLRNGFLGNLFGFLGVLTAKASAPDEPQLSPSRCFRLGGAEETSGMMLFGAHFAIWETWRSRGWFWSPPHPSGPGNPRNPRWGVETTSVLSRIGGEGMRGWVAGGEGVAVQLSVG